MGQLGKRLISSAVIVSISLFVVFAAPVWMFCLYVNLLALLGLNEFLAMAEKKGVAVNRPLALALGATVPFAFYFGVPFLVLVLICLSLFVYNFRPHLKNGTLVSVSVILFGIIYVPWFFSHFILIRDVPKGAFWVFYTVFLVKTGDAGAYFVGKKYGRNKLIEHISPNKSIEGAVGGFVTTVVLSLLSKIYLPGVSMGHLLILGAAIGVISQLGDLIESLLKRDAGVKDSGTVPGLGGILDVLDSLLLSAPIVHYYVTVLLKITA